MSDLTPRILISLSPTELEDFLTPADLDWLRTLPNVVWTTAPSSDPATWEALLLEQRPDVLVAAWKTLPLPAALLNAEHQFLKYVCYFPGSIRRLVPREFMESGLVVTNWGASVSRVVAECALLLIMMAHRRTAYWSVAMHREGAWKNEQTVTQSLFGRRVGIHGLGAIAQALLPMLAPFGVRLQAYSPSVPDALFQSLGVERAATLEDLFSQNDVLVELAPYTPENHHIIGEELLRLLPEDGVFINIGRGAVVDEDALLTIARENQLQIGLDVYETEPLPVHSPFRGLPNVALLPHLGGPTKDRRRDAGAYGINNLRRYLGGQKMEAVIDLNIYDRAT